MRAQLKQQMPRIFRSEADWVIIDCWNGKCVCAWDPLSNNRKWSTRSWNRKRILKQKLFQMRQTLISGFQCNFQFTAEKCPAVVTSFNHSNVRGLCRSCTTGPQLHHAQTPGISVQTLNQSSNLGWTDVVTHSTETPGYQKLDLQIDGTLIDLKFPSRM